MKLLFMIFLIVFFQFQTSSDQRQDMNDLIDGWRGPDYYKIARVYSRSFNHGMILDSDMLMSL